MATIAESTLSSLRSTVNAATSNPEKIPGVVFASVNARGEAIFNHASGLRGIDTAEPMSMDTVFWIASCTKMICAVACMQLVEKGKLDLDDANQVEKLCPELAAVKILKGVDEKGRPVLQEKKGRITLRMLLSHTAGFGYTFFNPLLKRYANPMRFDEFSGQPSDVLTQPLVNEPGTRFEYGINVDWAGTLLERCTGLSLNDYLQKNIFEPLDITDISMFPGPEMISRLAFMHQKYPDGKLTTRDHLYRRPLVADPAERANIYKSAGAGCFAKPTEYCKILATLLNNGTSPLTKRTILSPATVDTLLSNQIPHLPNFGRVGIPAAKIDLTNPVPDMYPQGEQPQGWNLAGFMNLEKCPTGRPGGTTWWTGLANLFWWLDRERGVAGVVASQILPFGDPDVMGLWFGLEGQIYAGLQQKEGEA